MRHYRPSAPDVTSDVLESAVFQSIEVMLFQVEDFGVEDEGYGAIEARVRIPREEGEWTLTIARDEISVLDRRELRVGDFVFRSSEAAMWMRLPRATGQALF